MSWASDRLEFLAGKYSYRYISEYTGIPISTISYVVRGERVLGAQYLQNLGSFYQREAYATLRARGYSAITARAFRSRAVAAVVAALSRSDSIVEALAQYRLPQYRKYLIAQGRFTNDEDTLQLLREAIQKGMASSQQDNEDQFGSDSPTIKMIMDSRL